MNFSNSSNEKDIMKKLPYILFAIAVLMATACEQEIIETVPADPDLTNISPDPCTGSAGSADFTKFVSIGNSFVAGVQAAALFDESQTNSLPAILNKQFACVGGSSTFNQPSINASLGWNLFITQSILGPPLDLTKPVLGRMLLQGASPRPTPQAYAVGNFEAVPNPTLNPGFLYTGSKTELNNFGVPAITLGQTLIPATGNWAVPNPAVGFNPFYARFASNPGTSTIIGDAVGAGGTFFMFWAGLDDFFLYAAFGGDATKAPLNTAPAFDFQYGAAIGSLLASNPDLKGVLGNFPNIFATPHFTAVAWNAIPLDAATATTVTASLANNYNAFLDGMLLGGYISAEENNLRKLSYTAGQNAILIQDETLTDLTPYMAGPFAGLLPYAQARQTKNTDIIPLSAGTVLGTAIGVDPTKINGVTVPLEDQYVLIPTEIAEIEAARSAFNATVKAVADANPTRLAHADVNKAFTDFITARAYVFNNITITPNINPPTGIFSEDGVHPNSRGYAYISNIFIEAINTTFGSSIPLTNISKYKATGLPIP
jgi:hypothetical protein